MVELVDTPGLEPGAVRCAGSSPVLGKLLNLVQKKVQKSLEICFWISIYPFVTQSGIAQSVEQMTVNHWVVGSNPSPGEFNKFLLIFVLNSDANHTISKENSKKIFEVTSEKFWF